ncbi:MAG: twin-arginine translocase TatA/TatE family subunit [Coriobacteriia bacterium]|nr:twin-arginine translocase TatA/TatE family subunit [Coriobacteriia bacterium]
MLGIGGWEFVVIVVLALLLFGPDKLPQFARTLGRFMRDFKRYQDLMESTIRAEVFAADPSLGKDPFKTGKDFREKVGGGGFTKPEPEKDESAESVDEVPDGGLAPEEMPEATAVVEVSSDEAPESEAGGDAAADAPPSEDFEDGEGERDEA